MESRPNKIRVDASGAFGIIWFIGWLFTITFSQLLWWQAILGLVIWPCYLGATVLTLVK